MPLGELTPEVKEQLDEFAEKGNQLEKEGAYEEAVQVWKEGLSLIPAAIGDVYFQQNMYAQAHECFDKARGNLSGGGYANPFIMLRLGECCLEIGDEKNALEYLIRAYMMEGKEMFEPDETGADDGTKYFEFLRTYIDFGEGAD